MKTENNEEVDYFLEFENDIVHINQLLDKEVAIYFVEYQCLNCGKNKKIF